MTMKKGLKLGNGAVVAAKIIIWNKEKLESALKNLTVSHEEWLKKVLAEKPTVATTGSYETLLAVEEITQYRLSTEIPITCPETANAIIQAFTNEADVELGFYIYHAHREHKDTLPVAFSGYDFAESYLDILSMVRSEIFVINGKDLSFHKRRSEPKQYPQQVGPQQAGPQQAGPQQAGPQQAGPQQASAFTADERVALLDKQFLEIWDEFCLLIPEGEYRVTPQFKVGPLDEDSVEAIANTLGHVMSIAKENNVLEKLNVDDLPLLMTPSVTKAATDARKREVLLDWLRKNSDTLAEVMSLEPIAQVPSLEHHANYARKVKQVSDLLRDD